VGRRGREGLNFGRQKRKINVTAVREVFSWMIEILLAIVLAFTFVYFIGLRTSVVGQSMSPTLVSGDEILVNRFVYKVTDPKRGDIIVFLPNGNEKSHYYVKRVIGVPGDTVLIQNGAVYINGEVYKEEIEAAAIEEAGLASEEITLDSDEYFVLGDNRNNSEDSRYANIGNIKKDYIIGKAWFRVAPFSSFGFFS
jgi:signal peptidase I